MRHLAALATVLVACGCGSPSREPAAPPQDAAQSLRRGLGAEPETLDPHLAEDNAALTVVADLYEGLTTEASDGAIVPGSAASWTVEDDGLSYAFTLRPGLRWSNGDPLTARHFVDGLMHALEPATAAPYASLLADIASAEAPAADTVRLRLRRPLPYLPALLALPVAAPRHPLPDQDDPPVNGAYRLVRRLPGERIELERNRHYHGAHEVAIARVTHLVVTDLTTELNLYRTGELDMTSEVPNSQVDALRESLGDELRIAPFLSVYSYAVNLDRLPNRDARRALAIAVDRLSLTQQVTGAGERPAYGWVPDGMADYSPARFEWSGLDRAEALDAARRYWDAARRAGAAPQRLTLCTDASANHRRTAVALADFWRNALGVQTDLIELEWNVYLDTREHPGDCDLLRFGWSADFLDPEAFAMVFESGHPQNTLGYASPDYDALLERSRGAPGPGVRRATLALAEARLLEDVPVIPLFFRVSKRLVKPRVEGVVENPLGHVASRNLRLVAPATKKGREASRHPPQADREVRGS